MAASDQGTTVPGSQWWAAPGPRRFVALRENPAGKKKTDEKALIPLPPTGLASFFCANPDVVQTNLQPRRAVGLCSRSAIAQNAKF